MGQLEVQLAIQESEKKVRSILEKSLDGIMLIDEKGIIIEWNYAQENIYGNKYGMVVGKPIWEVQHLYEPANEKEDGSYEKIKKFLFKKIHPKMTIFSFFPRLFCHFSLLSQGKKEESHNN